MSQTIPIEIHRILICPEHIYRNHHGRAPGDAPMSDLETIECIAGKGLAGDRFVGEKDGHKRQVTFFDLDVHRDLRRRFPEATVGPEVYRRNVVIEGVDLNPLIGRRFLIDDVVFTGVEECAPCRWMNTAFGPGAEESLRNRGGLRARILQSGTLTLGQHKLVIDQG